MEADLVLPVVAEKFCKLTEQFGSKDLALIGGAQLESVEQVRQNKPDISMSLE